jgi:hypothetical protein
MYAILIFENKTTLPDVSKQNNFQNLFGMNCAKLASRQQYNHEAFV